MPDFDLASAKPEGGFDLSSAMPDHSNIVANSQAKTFAPFPLGVKGRYANPSSPFGDSGPPTQEEWTPPEQAMAKEGIDITSGAPYGLRNRLSTLINPTDEQKKAVVNDYFKKDVGVTKNKYGELQYNDPATGRPTALESHSNDQFKAPTAGGTLDTVLSGGGAAAAGIPTAMATGNPALAAGAATLGGAGGQAIADIGKMAINSVFGVGNKDDVDQNIKDVGMDALKSGALTAAGELVGNVPNLGRWASQGFLKLKYGNAIDLQAGAQKAQGMLNDYYTLIGNNKELNPSIPELLPKESAARYTFDQARAATPALTQQEEQRVNENLDALSANYKTFTDQFKPDPNYQQGSSGYNIQQVLMDQKVKAQNVAQLQNSLEQDAARRQAQGLPAMSTTDMNQKMTEILNTAEQAGMQEKNKAYGDLKVMLGVPKEVAYDRTNAYWLQERQPENVMPYNAVTRAKLFNIWKEGVNLQSSPAQNGDKYFSAIPDGLYKDPSKPMDGLIDMRDRTDDIYSVIDNIQDMKSGVRAAMRTSRGMIPPDEHTQADVATIMEDNVGDYLQRKGNPAILDAWENAKQKAADYQRNFRTGILNQVMTREGGFSNPVYNSATSKLLMSSGKGEDQSGVARLGEILNGDPQANENVRSMIWSVYKDQFMPSDGIPTRATFQQFKDKMEGPMKTFFGQDDMDKMTTFEDMTDNLTKSSQKLAAFNKAWKRDPDYGGIPLNSNSLTNAVMSKSVAPQVLDKMTNMLRVTQPGLLKEWQSDTAAAFAKKTSDANGVPDPTLMAGALKDWKDRLDSVMEPGYTMNIGTLQRAAQIGTGGAVKRQLNPDKEDSILTKIVQTIWAPPLSEEGRFYQGVLTYRKRAAARVVYNALSSQEGLEGFIRNTAYQAANPTAGGVVADLGGRSLLDSLKSNNNGQQRTPENPDQVLTR